MEGGTSSKALLEKGKKSDKGRRIWTMLEEEVLIQSLKDAITSGYKSENGFRCGYLVFLEDAVKKVFPKTDLRGIPHINSKIHVWKKTHGTLLTMLSRSGVGWNETEKMIDATDEAWESIIKNDASARVMRYRRWPYYYDWCEIFGNDRANGEKVETFAEAVQGVLNMTSDIGLEMEVESDEVLRTSNATSESMSGTNPHSWTEDIKQKKTKKRKLQTHGEGLFIDAINKFTDMTRDTMSNLIKKFGHDIDATNDVFDALRMIEELTRDERLAAAEMLVEKPKKLSLFLSHTDEERLALVKKLLKSG